MADNLSWTPGAGADIATDQAGDGSHAQIIKLAVSTDGDKSLIPADSTSGIKSDGSSRGATIGGGVEFCDSTTPTAPVAGNGYIAPDMTRRSIIIQNFTGVDVWVGNSNVQQGQGLLITDGQTLVLDKSPCAAIYIWADSIDPVLVNWIEEKD